MPWEYLSSKPLDVRFLFVAGYLQHRDLIAGKRLVDLNCGTVRLLRYIPHTFARYLANDIHQQPEGVDPNLKFFPVADFEMVDRLRDEEIDVLMLFGTTDGRLCGSSWESRTSIDAFLALVRQHYPGTLIIEGSAEYDRNFGAIGALVGALDPYEIDHDVTINTTGQDGHGKRRIACLTPRTKPYNVHRRPSESIHEYYLRRSIECVSEFKNPRVLKTDACNESHDNLPVPGGIALNLPKEAAVMVLEWDEAVIAAARSAHPELEVRRGDIRTLADIPGGAFDVLLDLSTLDHIQPRDVPRALASYRRVLRENGILLLVFWASVDPRLIAEGDAGEWSHGRQYYFDIDFVRNTLAALQFELISEDHVYVSGTQILDCIKCRASSRA
jgi:methyltransferase family protein